MKSLLTIFGFVVGVSSLAINNLPGRNETRRPLFGSTFATTLQVCADRVQSGYIFKSNNETKPQDDSKVSVEPGFGGFALATSNLCTAYEAEPEQDGPGKCFMYIACLVDYLVDFSQPDIPFDCCLIKEAVLDLTFGSFRNATGRTNKKAITRQRDEDDCDASNPLQNRLLQKQCKGMCNYVTPTFIDRSWYSWICQNPFNSGGPYSQCVCEWS